MSVLPVGFGSALGGYQIERSLRFNSADSAYLNRTPASAGNRKTWTWSSWVKRGALGGTQTLFDSTWAANNNSWVSMRFASDTLYMDTYSESVQTSAVFSDPSAWYHIVYVIDTTQSTSTNRIKIFVNGVQQTISGTYPALNADLGVNTTNPHSIGRYNWGGSLYLGGYLTEVNFIDGQALTPSSFGETDSNTGVWKPKAFSGTYGTNGFYLKFADNSGTTSTTLGKDSSGNGNNWTPNNFSVTAGAGNDSMVDTPTSYGTDTGVGGEVRGNYCTLNPLNSAGSTLSNGNLDCVTSVSGGDGGRGTIAVTSGKWYWEFTPTNNGNVSFSGIALTTTASGSYYVAYYATTGNKYVIGSGSSAYGATYTNNDVIGVALDLDSGTKTVTFYKNNASQGAITITPSEPVLPIVDDGSGSAATTFNCNFGQRAFAYTAPSGFKALCTQNLPTPTIGATSTTQANDYFDVSLWTGTGVAQSITNSGSMQPDFVWTKTRSQANDNFVFDAIRGVNNYLITNSTNAESTVAQTLTAFNSNGFSVGTNNDVNASGRTFVGWQWRASNTTAVTNTAGTITSTVSANTTSGFSIVTYTGTGANATVGHGLGVAPSMLIIKNRTAVSGYNWNVYHASIGNTQRLFLDATSAAAAGVWNNTSPTSTVFTIAGAAVYNNNDNFVAYCFANVEGYSRAFSYTGNGSSDGPFVFLNFRPRFILTKRSDSADDWNIIDTARSTYNEADAVLFPNLSNAEYTTSDRSRDILSNGFKVRDTNAEVNASGGTYIGFAWAESPFKYSLGR